MKHLFILGSSVSTYPVDAICNPPRKRKLPITEPAEQEYKQEPLSWNERFFFFPDSKSKVYMPSKSPTRERKIDPVSTCA